MIRTYLKRKFDACICIASPGDCKTSCFQKALSLPTDFADLRFRIDSGKLHCCAFAKLRNAQLMKTERSEGHHEAVKALALSELGVMAIILIWNLVMLDLY